MGEEEGRGRGLATKPGHLGLKVSVALRDLRLELDRRPSLLLLAGCGGGRKRGE